MRVDITVVQPPKKPLLIFDGDCGFCRFWIARWQRITGDQVEYLPFQDPGLHQQHPELARVEFDKAVHLIEPDGRVYGGAEAAFRSLAVNPSRRWPLRLYQRLPGAAAIAELGYRFVANHRVLFSALTRFLWRRT